MSEVVESIVQGGERGVRGKEGLDVAGPAFGRCGDKEDLYRAQGMGDWLGLMRVANPRSMAGLHAARFVGIDAVVADGLLALGRVVTPLLLLPLWVMILLPLYG